MKRATSTTTAANKLQIKDSGNGNVGRTLQLKVQDSNEDKKTKVPKTNNASPVKKPPKPLHYPKINKNSFTAKDLQTEESNNLVIEEEKRRDKEPNNENTTEEEFSQQEETNSTSEEKIEPKGLKLSKKEIEEVFKFLDVKKKKTLTPKDLKERLRIFYPSMSNKEFKFLISEPEFTIATLTNILSIDTSNPIFGSSFGKTYDPVKEAFKVFDPNETGYIEEKHLKEIMEQLGYGPITSEDMKVLWETADLDKDGKITLEDFRNLTNYELN
ncbi:hypothetical protein ABK040_005812 [Willaertia magna]